MQRRKKQKERFKEKAGIDLSAFSDSSDDDKAGYDKQVFESQRQPSGPAVESRKDRLRAALKKRQKKQERESQPAVSRWKYLFFLVLIAGGGLSTVMPMFSKMYELSQTRHTYLDANNPEDLHALFKSGQPWCVLCSEASNDQELSRDHKMFYRATAMNRAEATGVNMGVLDCNIALPSGKSVHERFEFNTSESEVVFVTSNGNKPLQVPIGYFPTENHASSFVTYIKDKVGRVPDFKTITNTKQLQNGCLKRGKCVIVLGDTRKPEKDMRYALKDIVSDRRDIRFVYVNAKTFLFSVERKVKWPYHLEEYPKVFYVERGEEEGHVAMKVMKEAFGYATVETFLQSMDNLAGQSAEVRAEELSSIPLKRLTLDTHRAVQAKATAKRKKAEREAAAEQKREQEEQEAKKPQIKIKDDVRAGRVETADADSGTHTKAELEAERLRREEMDAAMKERIPEYNEDAEEMDEEAYEETFYEEDDVFEL